MTREEIVSAIRRKKSVLCVGLDTDPAKLPECLKGHPAAVLAFNKAIIEATALFAVAYKINIAFYESMGPDGWNILRDTLALIPADCFSIADAKRGDIGNTAEQYARTFYHTYPFDSVTVAPYMGHDSVTPFLNDAGKWAIVLGLTSNAGSEDFQMLETDNGYLYEEVLRKVAGWGSPGNTMFVVGATRDEHMQRIREILPDHFLLVPGVGAQGGDLATVCTRLMNEDAGILINVSRAILYAGSGEDYAGAAAKAAAGYQQEMAAFL